MGAFGPLSWLVDRKEVRVSRSDYAHWNEEQDRVWWEEEGRHHGYEDEPDPDRDLDEEDWQRRAYEEEMEAELEAAERDVIGDADA